MRTWWTLVLVAEGLTSFWLHSMLVGLAQDGRLDEMCLLQRGTAPSKGLSTILRVTGVFFVLKSVIHALIYLAILLLTLTASGIVDADAEPYPFSSPEYNLTVAQDMICTHVVPDTDNNYANVTEAIELCREAGAACGGVGTLRCDGTGSFRVCHSEWLPVAIDPDMRGSYVEACVASFPSQSRWLDKTTDPIQPAISERLMKVAGVLGLFLGFKYWLQGLFCMAFVLACTAAAVRIESAKTQLQELGASDERASGMGDAAMALLVELESAVTSPINTVWGATASWLFVVVFVKALETPILYCTARSRLTPRSR